MKAMLKKDLIIKAGTVFDEAPRFTQRCGSGHLQAVFGLTKDSSGYVEYSVDNSNPDDVKLLEEWFDFTEE